MKHIYKLMSRENIFKKIMEPNNIKRIIYLAYLIFIPGLFIAIIISFLFGGTQIPPFSYNFIDNFISDLGSRRYTPTPFILDGIAITTSILLIPLFWYSNKITLEYIEREQSKKGLKTFSRVGCYLGLIGLYIGLVGFFGIGLFSEDRNFDLNGITIHYLFSVIVFGGLAIGSLIYGLIGLINETFIPKILSFFMLIGPLASVILYLVKPEPFTRPAIEWIMLACIFFWIIPVGIIILNMIKKES